VDFALDFVVVLARRLLDVGPVLVLLLLFIVGLAVWIGRREGWTVSDSVYFGFVTATTVGYGDFRPTRRAGKALAIVVAYLGLIQIGIIVALAVKAVTDAYELRAGLITGAPLSLPEAPGLERQVDGLPVGSEALRSVPPATR